MEPITAEQLDSLAPKAKAFYRDAFLNGADVLAKYGINDTALRLAHFMAQVLHESGALTITEESLFYTHAERIRDVWPTRFKTVADADAVKGVTKRINGGTIGLNERIAWLAKTKAVWVP